MKKILLLTAVAMIASVGFAQKASKVAVGHEKVQSFLKTMPAVSNNTPKVKGEKLPVLMRKQEARTTAKTSRRIFSDGIVYDYPEGTLFGGWNMGADPESEEFGRGYYFTTLMAPIMTDLTFVNRSAEAVTWSINGEDASDDVVEGNYVNNYSRNEDSQGSSLFYTPTITNATGTSYTIGEYNVYVKRGYTQTLGLMRLDSINTMYQGDPRGAELYNGQYYSAYNSWGLLSTDNLFGSGTYNDKKAISSVQVFDKPVSPLFFNKLIVGGESFTQPIPTGKQLTALITGVKEVEKTYKDGSTAIVKTADLDKVYATMIANSNDTIDFFSTTTRNQKTLKTGYVIYQKPGEVDILGNVIPGNIVIDEEFAIVLQGFDEEGVDFGIDGLLVEEYNASLPDAQLYFEDGTFINYTSHLVLDMGIYGMFDKAYAPEFPGMYTFENETLNYTILRAPVEGAKEEYGYGCYTDGSTGSAFVTENVEDQGYCGVPVFTQVSWFDADDNENYFVEELPEWIKAVSIDPTFGYGMNLVMFACDPLPEGTKGRYAQVKVYGQEADMDGEMKYSAESETITIVQGDVDLTGISTVKANKIFNSNAPVYNLAGQRVTNNFKGIVIRDGKKMLVK